MLSEMNCGIDAGGVLQVSREPLDQLAQVDSRDLLEPLAHRVVPVELVELVQLEIQGSKDPSDLLDHKDRKELQV